MVLQKWIKKLLLFLNVFEGSFEGSFVYNWDKQLCSIFII